MNAKLVNHIEIRELIEKEGFENLVVAHLMDIQGRVSTVETSMTWFKFIARGSIIVVLGFFGIDSVGMV